MTEIKKYASIHDVPAEWDTLIGDNIYMSREFEGFMESVSSCGQEYYAFYRDGVLENVFMSFIIEDYNLGMFTKFDIRGRMKLFYVPLSVTRAGIEGNPDIRPVLEYIRTLRGRKIILNIESPDFDCGFAKGLTCPKCILKLDFDSFEGYLDRLRSNYRYRYKKALDRSSGLQLEYLTDNSQFGPELYSLYLQVHGKSRIRVEKLPIEFFQGNNFKIFVLRLPDGTPVGFTQLLENGPELIFEFVGVDYRYNKEYDAYHRMLLEIVRYGIENGFKTIDFGQTADESKLKLGSEYTFLYAYLHSSNPIENAIFRKMAPRLQYRPVTEDYKVFK